MFIVLTTVGQRQQLHVYTHNITLLKGIGKIQVQSLTQLFSFFFIHVVVIQCVSINIRDICTNHKQQWAGVMSLLVDLFSRVF